MLEICFREREERETNRKYRGNRKEQLKWEDKGKNSPEDDQQATLPDGRCVRLKKGENGSTRERENWLEMEVCNR